MFPEVAWDTYCPVSRLGMFKGQKVVCCGLVVEQRLNHQLTGEPMKFLSIEHMEALSALPPEWNDEEDG